MFEGFTLENVDVGEVTLRVRYGGRGQPVVLVHGHPRTHTTWHRVAPRLADSFFVVCPDLRGYGRSTLPPDAPEHGAASKAVPERCLTGGILGVRTGIGRRRLIPIPQRIGSPKIRPHRVAA